MELPLRATKDKTRSIEREKTERKLYGRNGEPLLDGALRRVEQFHKKWEALLNEYMDRVRFNQAKGPSFSVGREGRRQWVHVRTCPTCVDVVDCALQFKGRGIRAADLRLTISRCRPDR